MLKTPRYQRIKKKFFDLTLLECYSFLITVLSVRYLFIFHSEEPYKYLNKVSLINELYEKVHPFYKPIEKLPRCNYSKILVRNRIKTTSDEKLRSQFDTRKLLNGSFSPATCNPQFSVAIIAPYRNRTSHLEIFLSYMHNFLRRQDIHFRIYIVEQQDDFPFNRGFLLNVGARQAMKDLYPCLILHDISLLPIDYINLYVCTLQPRHMSVKLDSFRYHLLYKELFGGAIAIRSNQFTLLNGYSNKFDFWGGEDDDLYQRIEEKGFQVVRYPPNMAHYKALIHPPQPRNSKRLEIIQENKRKRRSEDGITSLDKYIEKLTITASPLNTWIGVKRFDHLYKQ